MAMVVFYRIPKLTMIIYKICFFKFSKFALICGKDFGGSSIIVGREIYDIEVIGAIVRAPRSLLNSYYIRGWITYEKYSYS